MSLQRTLLVCLLAAGLARPAGADSSAGGESMDFLLLDANARAVGLGGAYTALATDANALLYNPAGLGLVKSQEVTFMHNQYVEGLTQQYAGYASKSGLGANLNYLNFGSIPRTSLSKPDGTLGSFGLSDLAVGGGYGRAFLDRRLSLGLGAKYLRESVDNVSASGYALDAGVLASVAELPGLSFGASVLNIGPEVRYVTKKEKLPLTLRGGAAYNCTLGGTEATVAFDLSKVRTDQIRMGVGVETLLSRLVALRLGYTSRNDTDMGITGGLGVSWRTLGVDYAFTPFGDLGLAHRVSLSLRWGSAAETRPVAARRELIREVELQRTMTVEERFARAQKALRRGDWVLAQAEFAAAAGALEPEDRRRVVYYERMGFIALRQGNIERAKGFYMEGLKFAAALGLRDNAVGDAYAGMGECLVRQQNYSYALKFYGKALEVGTSSESRLAVEAQLKRLSAMKP